MQTIAEIQIHNGLVREVYTVARIDGDIFIHCQVGDDYTDIMHIDRAAAERVAHALLLSVATIEHSAEVIEFPRTAEAKRRTREFWDVCCPQPEDIDTRAGWPV